MSHRKSSLSRRRRRPKRNRNGIDLIQQHRMALRAKAARATQAETNQQDAEKKDWLKYERQRLIKKNNRLVRLYRKMKKRYAAVIAMNENKSTESRTIEDDMRVAFAIIPVSGMGVAVRNRMVRQGS